jgi:hypothetical protein
MFVVIVDAPLVDASGKTVDRVRCLDYVGDLVTAVVRCNRRENSSIATTILPWSRQVEDRFPVLPNLAKIDAIIAQMPRKYIDWPRRIRNRVSVN